MQWGNVAVGKRMQPSRHIATTRVILAGNPRRMVAMIGDIGCDRAHNRYARMASAIT